jgi:hypothetical protein
MFNDSSQGAGDDQSLLSNGNPFLKREDDLQVARGGDVETTVVDEKLKKKIALYYHSFVSYIEKDDNCAVSCIPGPVVRSPPVAQLHEADEDAVP